MIFKRGKFYWYEFEFRGQREHATTGVLVGKGVKGEESPKEKAKQAEAWKRNGIGIRQCWNQKAAAGDAVL